MDKVFAGEDVVARQGTTEAHRAGLLSTPAFWVAAFALLTLAARIAGLATEIINWDEDTFLVMGQDVLRGHLPYVAAFDNKPPGIFLWSAGVLALFGPSIAAVRLAGALFMFASACGAFAIARRFAPVREAGVATLLMLTASLDPMTGGFSSTEWPCAAFLIAAAWLMLARGDRLWAAFLAGGAAALAVLFRTNAAVVVLALGAVYAAGWWLARLRLHRGAVFAFIAGGLIPPALLALVYAAEGQFHALWLANVIVPFSYAREQNGFIVATRQFLEASAIAMRQWPFTLGPLALLCGAGLFCRRPGRDALVLLPVSGAAVLAILVCGTYYAHYLIQALPFAAPWAARALAAERRHWALAAAAMAAVAVTAIEVAAGASVLSGRTPPGADIRHAAEALRPALKPGDAVWAVKNHLILVYLDRPPVSPAVTHPSNIARRSIIDPLTAAGYLKPDELDRIMASAPAYIVTDAPHPVPYYLEGDDAVRFEKFISARYRRHAQFGDVLVLTRRPGRFVIPPHG